MRITPIQRWKKLPPSLRARLVFGVKLLIAVLLLGFLSKTDRLSLAKLALFGKAPEILLYSGLVWLFCGILLSAARWRLLLLGVGLHYPYRRIVLLQMISGFLALGLPGSIGGDAVRFLYLAREKAADAAGREGASQHKAALVLSLIVDRLCGLGGLFATGAVAFWFGLGQPWMTPGLRPLLLYTASVFTLGTAGLLLLLTLPRHWFVRALNRLTERWPRLHLLRRLSAALLAYSGQRWQILAALALSVAMHGFALLYYYQLCTSFGQGSATIAGVASMTSLAMLVTAVPLAPGGFGIGHLAYDHFFGLIGVRGGADVYNAALLAQGAMCLIGAVPYLFWRRQLRGGGSGSNDGDAATAVVSVAAALPGPPSPSRERHKSSAR